MKHYSKLLGWAARSSCLVKYSILTDISSSFFLISLLSAIMSPLLILSVWAFSSFRLIWLIGLLKKPAFLSFLYYCCVKACTSGVGLMRFSLFLLCFYSSNFSSFNRGICNMKVKSYCLRCWFSPCDWYSDIQVLSLIVFT